MNRHGKVLQFTSKSALEGALNIAHSRSLHPSVYSVHPSHYLTFQSDADAQAVEDAINAYREELKGEFQNKSRPKTQD